MIETPILIVGAGPSGLMLSAQLHRYGADHVIIDQKPGVTTKSKALAVQARTLEQYRQLGIAEQAITQGFIAQSLRFIVNGEERANIPFGEIGAGLSPYPYLFILEQSQNETLLHDQIASQGGQVHWNTTLQDVSQSAQGYTGTLSDADGRAEPFRCQYLVGCDGASSAVRQFLNVPFRGRTNEQLFFVADIDVEMAFEKHGLLLVLHEDAFLAFFPMARPNQYRVVGPLPSSTPNLNALSFDQISTHIVKNFGSPIHITDHAWHAGYRVHHRIVDNFRSGNAFLVGDAAHIHSPAGGQGMNTGLGDAVNLGWKLAGVVNGWCAEGILESYNDERRPFGVQLVQTTDQAFELIVSKKRFPQLFRTHVLPRLMRTALKFERVRRLMFKTVSQTRIHYRKSPLSDGTGTGALRSGDRFPWFNWEDGNSFDWLQQPGYVVLIFGGVEVGPCKQWDGPQTSISVAGAAAVAAQNAGLPSAGYAIVRPDMHLKSVVNARSFF